jgi:hypothetical protein
MGSRIVAVIASAVLCGALAAMPAQAAFPGQNGKIAFQSGGRIWTMNPDGTDKLPLTTGGGARGDDDAVWSPDGTQVAFHRLAGSNQFCCAEELNVIDADGSDLRRVSGWADNPSFAPTGSRLAFIDPEECFEFDHCDNHSLRALATMSVDGTDRMYLTNPARFESDLPYFHVGEASWSPTSDTIAFTANPLDGSGFHIYTIQADGSGLTRLTNAPFGTDDGAPSWSPDGSRIVFQRSLSPYRVSCGVDEPSCEIFVMDANGANQTRITNNALADQFPTWSPDGMKIAFERGSGCPRFSDCTRNDVYTMDADGTNEVNLTSDVGGTGAGGDIDWGPAMPNDPPICSSVTASPNVLSPADRTLPLVSLSGASDPDGDTVALTVTGVTQDEALTGSEDKTSPDAFSKQLSPAYSDLLDNQPNQAYLRAERRNSGDGRVYRIEFSGSDGKGGTCSGTTKVSVPRTSGVAAADSPASFNSFRP